MKFWRALRVKDDKMSTVAQSQANLYVPHSLQLEKERSHKHVQACGYAREALLT